MTDRPEPLPQRPESLEAVPATEAEDVLSDVLRAVHLTGAMLFVVDATPPWISQAPDATRFRQTVLPGCRHLISFHIVIEGECDAGLSDGHPRHLGSGDILVIPHGHPYYLCDLPPGERPPCDTDASLAFFREMAAGRLPTAIPTGGEGAPRTRFICGFLGCDRQPFNPVLSALPPVMVVRRGGAGNPRMDALIEFALGELRGGGGGSRAVLLRLCELMFLACLRHHLSAPSDETDGWLAALGDPPVARALALLHRAPGQPWTLAELAARSGTSRTVLTERFRRLTGQPPMRYLAAWRMQKAAGLLSGGDLKVAAVAAEVGYASEAAFSRAFRHWTGQSPNQWRHGQGPERP